MDRGSSTSASSSEDALDSEGSQRERTVLRRSKRRTRATVVIRNRHSNQRKALSFTGTNGGNSSGSMVGNGEVDAERAKESVGKLREALSGVENLSEVKSQPESIEMNEWPQDNEGQPFDAFSDLKEDFIMTNQPQYSHVNGGHDVINAVLAFQRWRHMHLKNVFSQELKKVLEEAQKDEACLLSMEHQLVEREKNLARALAEIGQLQAHMSAVKEEARQNLHNKFAMESQVEEPRSRTMEEEVMRRDIEINRLRQRLKCFEDERTRLDGTMQANIALLQKEKVGALNENRALLDQLARRDEEVRLLAEQIEKLRRQISDTEQRHRQQVLAWKSEGEAQLMIEQKQWKKEKDILEMEISSIKEQTHQITQEKDDLRAQLNKAFECTNAASNHVDKLQMKIDSLSDGRVKASEAIAADIVEHLKILTSHIKQMEVSYDRDSFSLHSNGLLERTKMPARIVSDAHEYGMEEITTFQGNLLPPCDSESCFLSQKEESVDNNELCPQVSNESYRINPTNYVNYRSQCDGPKDWLISATNGPAPHHCSSKKILGVVTCGNCVTWRWKWIAEALRANCLAIKLKHFQGLRNKEDIIATSTGRSISAAVEKELRIEIPGNNKLVSILLHLWRAFITSSRPQKEMIFRSAMLDRLLTLFPLWIRRIGLRRRLEHYFLEWCHYIANVDKSERLRSKQCIYNYFHTCYPGAPRREELTMRKGRNSVKATRNHNSATFKSSEIHECGMTGNVGEPELRDDSASHNVAISDNEEGKNEKKQLVLQSSSICKRSSFTSRALRVLQISLQQELQDLQLLLGKEMEVLQRQLEQRKDKHDPNTEGPVSSFWEVCNKLASSLVEAHKQLLSIDREFELHVCKFHDLPENMEPKTSSYRQSTNVRYTKRPVNTTTKLPSGHQSNFTIPDISKQHHISSKDQNSLSIVVRRPNANLSRNRGGTTVRYADMLRRIANRSNLGTGRSSTVHERGIIMVGAPFRGPEWI